MGKLAEIMYHYLKFNEPYQYQSLKKWNPKGSQLYKIVTDYLRIASIYGYMGRVVLWEKAN
jgi:hypothetical protein